MNDLTAAEIAVELAETRERHIAAGEMDPCGECVKGTCDHCDMCEEFADPPWQRTN